MVKLAGNRPELKFNIRRPIINECLNFIFDVGVSGRRFALLLIMNVFTWKPIHCTWANILTGRTTCNITWKTIRVQLCSKILQSVQ